MRTLRHADLLTHCLPVGDPVFDQHKLLRDAAVGFHLPSDAHRPFCIGCRASFLGDDGAKVAAYLFAVPVGVAGLVATSGFCVDCMETLSPDEVDRVATRVLRKMAPGGKFLDPRR
ncbi:MAG: hypothetical protein C0480_01155 [Bradyrhizobium sp.]|nr:hypothetical protein [Bradyrhizobium sp.]